MLSEAAVSERQTLIETLQDVGLIHLAQLKNAGGRAFDSLGLTYGQAMLLIFVGRGYSTPSELTELLGIVPSGLSGLTTRLEEERLIKRNSNPSDARRVTLTLTPRGAEAYQKVNHAWRRTFPVDLQAFSDDELKHLVEAARIVTRHGLV